MKHIIAIDVSGSTINYPSYYDQVRKLVSRHPEAKLYTWDTEYTPVQKAPESCNDCAGTKICAVLQILEITEEEAVELTVVTDAELYDKDVDECFLWPNRKTLLNKVKILRLYFIGDMECMNTRSEKCLYQRHMKLFLGVSVDEELLEVPPVFTITEENLDNEKLVKTSHLDVQVRHIAKHGTTEEKMLARVTLIRQLKELRSATDTVHTTELGEYFKCHDAEACFEYVKKLRFSDVRKAVETKYLQLVSLLDNCDSSKTYEVQYIANATSRNLQVLKAEENETDLDENSEPDDVTSILYDPVLLHVVSGTSCLLIRKAESKVLSAAELKKCSTNPLHLLGVNSECFLKLVEHNILDINTVVQLRQKISPTTRSELAGVLALNPEYGPNNLNVIAKTFFGCNKLPGHAGLWQIAVLTAVAFHHPRFQNSIEFRTKVREYCLRICEHEEHYLALSPLVEPPVKARLRDCLWYVIFVSSMFDTGRRNVLRSFDFDFCQLYEFLFSEKISPSIVEKNSRFKLWNAIFKRFKEDPQRALTFVAELHFESRDGCFIENENDMSGEVLFAWNCLEALNPYTPAMAKLPDEKRPTFQSLHRNRFSKNWQNMLHVVVEYKTTRHSPICVVTGKNWKECAGDYNVRYESLFECFARFIRDKQQYPKKPMDLLKYHNSKYSKGFKLCIYPVDILQRFEVILDKMQWFVQNVAVKTYVDTHFCRSV